MSSWKRTLTELLAGIVLVGIGFEFIGLIFVKDRLSHSIGMLIGVVMALAMATHMAFSLSNALDWDEEHAKSSMWKSNLLSYVLVVVCFLLSAYFRIGNMISCFFGIMTLKLSAYLQPYLHRLCNKYILKIEEEGGCVDGIMDANADAEDDSGDWTECGLYDSRSD